MLTTEIEARFLDINPESLRQKLHDAGAVLVSPERLMQRETFDFADKKLAAQSGWVRLRNEGDRITLSYKQEESHSLSGMKEATVDISSFEDTRAILACIGLVSKSAQETKRESWKLENTDITIDTWPWIPPVLEIEGPHEDAVKKAAHALGLEWSKATHGGIDHVYTHYFDITKDAFLSLHSIRFTETPPAWMQDKKRS